MDFLDREDLIQSEPRGDTTPPDLTRTPLELPASRALRLQALTRGDEGFVEKASKYFGGTMMEARRLLGPVDADGDDEEEEEEAAESSDSNYAVA